MNRIASGGMSAADLPFIGYETSVDLESRSDRSASFSGLLLSSVQLMSESSPAEFVTARGDSMLARSNGVNRKLTLTDAGKAFLLITDGVEAGTQSINAIEGAPDLQTALDRINMPSRNSGSQFAGQKYTLGELASIINLGKGPPDLSRYPRSLDGATARFSEAQTLDGLQAQAREANAKAPPTTAIFSHDDESILYDMAVPLKVEGSDFYVTETWANVTRSEAETLLRNTPGVADTPENILRNNGIPDGDGDGRVRFEIGGGALETQVEFRASRNGGYYVAHGVTEYSDHPLNPSQTPEHGGYFVRSMPDKTVMLTGRDGAVIKNLDEAKQRARELLGYGALTTSSDEQVKTARDFEARRGKLFQEIAFFAQATKIKAPSLNYSSDASEPNRMDGNTPQARTVERTAFGVTYHSESKDGRPSFAKMIVPNIVAEFGPKKARGKSLGGASVTPQPFTGFFPVSFGLPTFRINGKKYTYNRTYDSKALMTQVLNPAGFYPGDANWPRWNNEFRTHPERTDEIRIGNYGVITKVKTENWGQVYFNTPNLLNPVKGLSFNGRLIKVRDEGRLEFYDQSTIDIGRKDDQILLSLYYWLQEHVKTGVGNVFLPGQSAAYGTVGAQGEAGVYVILDSTPLSSPVGTVDLSKLNVADTHIVNGSYNSNNKDFKQEFGDILSKYGIQFHSESVIAILEDRSAGVYMQASNSTDGGVITVDSKQYVSLDDISKKFKAIGNDFGDKYKELKFISAATLAKLNEGKTATINVKGRRITVVEVGEWINTGARVGVGGPGLFLPADIAPGK